ncbi:MAG: ribulose-phosphate 3-epimerase [Actinobacteria bacterium]|jgi:ribulose-phosphate 3-epimerase|nr:ribulose-phosphate 3-epimerase [Actinomycetota bacterium]
MLISPSVLNSDLGRLSEEIAKVEGVADLIHLDVMDNHFVPNLTFGLPVVQRVIEQTSLPADVHLMITDPDRWAPAYGDAGAYSVTFHIEAAKDPVLLAKNIKSTGARVAAALKPGTPLESLDGVLEHLDMVLIMTVEPGFGGQAFMSDMMPKVSRAHELGGAKLWIEVDGGVSHNTILECKQAGANVFVAGSCVYSSEDPAQVVRDLKALVGE